jgi:hypothetical protein
VISRLALIAEAREWLMPKTRFQHQQSMKNVVSDCLGFGSAVAAKMGVPNAIAWRDDPRFKNYARTPDSDALLAACDQYMDAVPLHLARIADVLVIAFKHKPMHFAFVSALDPMLHCFELRGGVVEHGVDETWRRRIHRVYRLRGLD